MLSTSRRVLTVLSLGLLSSCAPSYQQVHQKALLVDTHNDVLSQVVMEGMAMDQNLTGKAHTDLTRLNSGGMDLQVFAVFCDESYGPGRAFAFANAQIDSLEATAKRNPKQMQVVYSVEQMQEAVKAGRIAALTGVEGGHMIEEKLENIDHFYRRGVRYLTLTWNNSTTWASSAADEVKGNGRKGLTDFGKQVVQRMNQLGMLVDLSHVGEKTFYDVLETTTKPVLVSHSCAAALCPHSRNLTDDQLKALAKNGGVVHLNFFSEFLDSTYNKRVQAFITKHQSDIKALEEKGATGPALRSALYRQFPDETATLNPPISVLIQHIDHVVKVAGIDHVGLGSDYDGISSAPKGLEDVSTYPLITKALMERGYKRKDIEKILGGNFIRIWKANEASSAATK